MKRSLFRIIAFALCAFLLMFSFGAFAESTGDPSGEKDFGDFAGDSDYGYDPGPDTGSDWDGSSDWGDDYDNGGYIFMPIGGSAEMGSCSGQDMMMVLIIILIIMLVLWFLSRRTQTPVTTTVQRTDDSMLTPMDTYVNTVDPNFSIVDMQKRFANLYVQLQDCWCAKNLEPLRPYLTDELYTQSDRQLDEMRKNYQTPHVERIAVLGTNIRGYFQRDGMDHLIVEMSTRINTYVTDDTNGGIVRGDPNSEKFSWKSQEPPAPMRNTSSHLRGVGFLPVGRLKFMAGIEDHSVQVSAVPRWTVSVTSQLAPTVAD